MMNGWVWNIVSRLAFIVPYVLVWVGGAAFALSRRERHPKASMLAAGGCAILVFSTLVSTGMQLAVQYFMLEVSGSYEYLGWAYTIIAIGDTMTGCLGNGLLIAAVFVDRVRPA